MMEASCYQLEDSAHFHPRAAAVRNVTADHVDHHGDMARYVGAKARGSRSQTRPTRLQPQRKTSVVKPQRVTLAQRGERIKTCRKRQERRRSGCSEQAALWQSGPLPIRSRSRTSR